MVEEDLNAIHRNQYGVSTKRRVRVLYSIDHVGLYQEGEKEEEVKTAGPLAAARSLHCSEDPDAPSEFHFKILIIGGECHAFCGVSRRVQLPVQADMAPPHRHVEALFVDIHPHLSLHNDPHQACHSHRQGAEGGSSFP